MTLWFRNHSISLSTQYCKNWSLQEVGWFRLRKNDWSLGYSCLDINMNILKLAVSLTFWNMPFQRIIPGAWR